MPLDKLAMGAQALKGLSFLKGVEQAVEAAKSGIEGRRRQRETRESLEPARRVASAQPPPRDPNSRAAKEDELRRKAEAKKQAEYARGRPNPEDYADTPDLAKEFIAEQGGEDFGGDLAFSEQEILDSLEPERAALRKGTEQFIAEREGEAVKEQAQRFFDVPEQVDSQGFYPPTLPVSMQSLEEYEAGQKVAMEPKSLAALKSEQAAEPPRAVVVEPDEGKLKDYFRVATGTPFDPKSSKDRAYMEKIKKAMRDNPDFADLSARQFALKLYAMG